MNPKYFLINQIYCLLLTEVLDRDIFMSKAVNGHFPCKETNSLSDLSFLIFSKFSFLFPESPGCLLLSPLICITMEVSQKLLFFPIKHTIEALSQSSISLV